MRPWARQVGVQLYAYADDVALPAFLRRTPPLLSADRAAIDRDISWPPGPRQQTRPSGVRRPNDGTYGQTDRRMLDSLIDTGVNATRTLGGRRSSAEDARIESS